jgi:8-oxo-dGTP diphosphatase
MRNKNNIQVATNVIVRDGNKVLLGKRKNDAGWCSPGGHVERGESVVEAAKRELYEETGITAVSIRFAHTYNDTECDDFHYVTVNMVVDEWIGLPEIMEEDKFYEWRWFLYDELPENMFSHHRKLIEMVFNGVEFGENIQ